MGLFRWQNRTGKRLVCLVLCAVFLTALLPAAGAYTERAGLVSVGDEGLNVRDGVGGNTVGQLENGAVVTVLDELTAADGALWYKIRYDGGPDGCGYVAAAYITVGSDAPSAGETPAPTTAPAPETTTQPTPETTPDPTPEPASETRESYMARLTEAGFPASYHEGLWALHQKYPSWEFRAFSTGLNWAAAVEEEHVLGRSLVSGNAISSWKSTQEGAYNWVDNTWNVLDSGGWVAASREIIAYYMDPRNSLDSEAVFQFLYQGFDGDTQTKSGMTAMVKGSFLADTGRDLDNDGSNGVTTYVDSLYAAGEKHGVNPYVLAAMMIQEMGTAGKSDSISGTNSRFPGYYNAFNLGAYKDKDFTAVERGLWYASGGNNGGTSYGRPWNTLYRAIMGGGEYYAKNFVNRGQNTLYLKRFNVQGSTPFRNQYMTNVSGAHSEGRLLGRAYSGEMRAEHLIFSIPVYEGMPASACPMPVGDGSPNTKLSALTVSGGVLSPEFHRDVTEYTVIVPHDTASVTVSAQPLDENAAVTGTGTAELAVGSNRITVTVTAGNGTKGTYTLTLIRREAEGPVSITGPYRLGADGRISGIAPGTTASQLLEKLGLAGGTAALEDSGGNAKTSGTAVTGDVLKIWYDAAGTKTLYGSYSVLIYGDINGDGAVMINDLIKIRNHLMGSGPLTGLSLAAADVNRDGGIKINDLIKLRNHIAGGAAIDQ